jgi:hypothetical protein
MQPTQEQAKLVPLKPRQLERAEVKRRLGVSTERSEEDELANTPQFDMVLDKLTPKQRLQVLRKMGQQNPGRRLTGWERAWLTFNVTWILLLWTIPLVLVGAACMITLVLIPLGIALWGLSMLPHTYMLARSIEKKAGHRL